LVSILDIRHAEKISGFDFGRMYEGLVVENSMFETSGSVYVTIPELFLGKNTERAIGSQAYIDSSKIMSDNPNLKYSTTLNQVNYIECYPIVLNSFTIGSLKPRRGDTVMVYFINGDVKLPYFFNAHLLKGEEEVMNSSNENLIDPFEGFGYYRLIKLKADPMFGPDVHLVGTKLESLGYNVKADEEGTYYYDYVMYNAIITFQRRMGMTEDGEVGTITFRTLMRYGIK